MGASKFQIKRKCPVCGEEFMAKTIESLYCSSSCSKVAWKRKHDEEERNKRLDEVVKAIPKDQELIKVSEAYALFGISRDTLYRLIRKGSISHVNLGTNQIRVNKKELLELYPLRPKATAKPKPVAKLFSLEPKDCYTIGEICRKFKVNDSTVFKHICKYSIPTRYIGNFVYAPKKEIDKLYKGAKL